MGRTKSVLVLEGYGVPHSHLPCYCFLDPFDTIERVIVWSYTMVFDMQAWVVLFTNEKSIAQTGNSLRPLELVETPKEGTVL